MFTTDLLLFGQATESQIANMMEVLDDLCAASGQLISKEKTRIMFSSNTPVGIHRNIATLYGFREVEDLGLYLGVPLSGKSPRINNYQFLIDKVYAKLSHLKCNQLSFDGRVTLSKLVIEALHTYSMMSNSSLWKNFAREWATNSKFIQWEIGDGASIKAWDDYWVQVGRKLHNVMFNHGLSATDTMLIDLVNINDNWNLRVIKDNILGPVVQQIRAIAPPHRNSWHKDCCIWSGTANGLFPIASSYELRDTSIHVAHARKWSRIWKLVVPERICFHVWMIHIQGLKTNQLLFQRKLRNSFCGNLVKLFVAQYNRVMLLQKKVLRIGQNGHHVGWTPAAEELAIINVDGAVSIRGISNGVRNL
ncbi:hypothetical protein KIW84_024554 [Lathyrus oleraceus]|uniref:Reverse transcriptase zinc-binding domain-containing protein n=1 Tax=Pisum sativum TaxID=3888 RepID=A0A9D4YGU4_PEA|nr:hypothetical protein KIW84_024554 [Pisum sativum]